MYIENCDKIYTSYPSHHLYVVAMLLCCLNITTHILLRLIEDTFSTIYILVNIPYLISWLPSPEFVGFFLLCTESRTLLKNHPEHHLSGHVNCVYYTIIIVDYSRISSRIDDRIEEFE